MTSLEILAPARDAEIGIAAIRCGADAVYIAGPKFGARHAAGNDFSEVARLCSYAHRFGARIYLTLNTILYDNELEEARAALRAAAEAGVDAVIVQDFAVAALAREAGVTLPLHASTQCAIRTPERAALLESLGFERLILERQLSMEEIRAIRAATSAELEFFVHGALCVSYSGNCYLSENLAGRSANRGECVQACRSLYDLVDASGKVLVRNKALLSLRDFNLLHRMEDLAEAGVCSFKIEGRLKSMSYVKNIVRQYSIALDSLIEKYPDKYCRSSYGRVSGGFTPAPDKTFNRGYTPLYIDGKRGKWSSMDAPTSLGEKVGVVGAVRRGSSMTITLRSLPDGMRLENGDGFAFVGSDGSVTGFRGDVCRGKEIVCKSVEGLSEGMSLWRNTSIAFERELEKNMPERLIRAVIDVNITSKDLPGAPYILTFTATAEDGRKVSVIEDITSAEPARDRERMLGVISGQLSKKSGDFTFTAGRIDALETIPILSVSFLNGVRRTLAEKLAACHSDLPSCHSERSERISVSSAGDTLGTSVPRYDKCAVPPEATYLDNISNSLSRSLYERSEDAYELTHRKGAELMRTRYCIRYELGLCSVHQGARPTGPLFLLNNGRRLALTFDCPRCEMTVSE
ncbi:MAG: U32 family peptidase [Bacteroidales bacterium]|nr:U32 family peptidase [Bacteroidales bacterium]